MERYIKEQTRRDMTHGICPTCYEREMKALGERSDQTELAEDGVPALLNRVKGQKGR